MDVYGHHIPLLVESGAVSLFIAVAVVAAKALTVDRLHATTIVPEGTPPEAAPASANPSLAQARVMILDALYRASLSCEDALRAPAADTSDISDACGAFAAALRRRRPWLPPSLAERADEFVRTAQSVDTESLLRAISTLRRGLEIEFRSVSGAARR